MVKEYSLEKNVIFTGKVPYNDIAYPYAAVKIMNEQILQSTGSWRDRKKGNSPPYPYVSASIHNKDTLSASALYYWQMHL